MVKKKRKVRVQVYLEPDVYGMAEEIVRNSRGSYPTVGNVIVNLVNDKESIDEMLYRSRNR